MMQHNKSVMFTVVFWEVHSSAFNILILFLFKIMGMISKASKSTSMPKDFVSKYWALMPSTA